MGRDAYDVIHGELGLTTPSEMQATIRSSATAAGTRSVVALATTESTAEPTKTVATATPAQTR